MRRLRYNVAMSLDGYIADSQERFDWIPDDDTVDFAGLFARVDTFILGRRTYETVLAKGELPWRPGMRVYVVSRTLQAGAHEGVDIARRSS
jgi:dihydrofolate reductase